MSNRVLTEASQTAANASAFRYEERYRFLSRILESFTGTLELKEVLRRIVTMTREEFGADRGWLLHPINAQAEAAKVRFAVSAPDGAVENKSPPSYLSLKHSAKLIQRLLDAEGPMVVMEDDPDLDREQAALFQVRSEIVQVLRPRDDEAWAFGLHQTSSARNWTDGEISLFAEVGRYATLALNNTLLHERAVRELAKANAILGQIPESAAIFDAEGRLERVNAASQREPDSIFDTDPESRLRTNLPRYLNGDALTAYELPSMRAIRGEIVTSDYLVRDTRHSHDRVVSVSAAPIRDDRDHIIGSVVLSRDVTEERQIEDLAQAMAERSARLDSILSSMTDGLWVYDANGQVVSVNEAAITMFGFGSRTQAVEHGSFAQLNLRYPDGGAVPPDDLPHSRALRGTTVPDYLAVGRHFITGKDLDLSIAAAPIESNGVVGAVLVIRDITALQELDRKKDEFLSVASHELRTPLTTIKGYTQLLTQTINNLPAAEQMTYLIAILGEIDRMMGLISELLDVSRIESKRLLIDRQPIRWLEFLDQRVSAFRVQNPARTIRFSADIPETTLQVDPDRMRQVVDNLISNAIKYSGEESDIELFARIDDSNVITVVSDHGIGIPADEIPKLFERFHRARNVSSRYYGGLGLGLYIAKAIVEAHHGSISVFSEEGRGASFTIRLPLS